MTDCPQCGRTAVTEGVCGFCGYDEMKTMSQYYIYAVSTPEGSMAMYRWPKGGEQASCWWMGTSVWFPDGDTVANVMQGVSDGQYRIVPEDEAKQLHPEAFAT